MSALPADQPTPDRIADEFAAPLLIPVIAETVVVSRELVETGRVRLTKTVTEEEQTLPLDLRHEQVDVRRVPVNRFLPDELPAPDSRREGDTLIIPVLREVLVKRLLLVEELHVTTRQQVAAAPQTVTLRHEHMQVERLPPTDT